MSSPTRRRPADQSATRVSSGIVRDNSTWAMYSVLALFAFIETCLGPSMPFIRDKLGINFTVASLHFSAVALGSVIVGVAGERVISRIGRFAAVWAGLGGMTVGAALVAVSPTVVGTLFGALVIGLVGTLALVANQATLSDLHGDKRAVALTESNVAASSASVFAPLAIGALVAIGAGWQWALIATVPLFGLLFWRFRGAAIPSAPRPVEKSNAGSGLPRVFWYYCAALFLAASVEWTIAYWGADFLNDVVGMSKGASATAMSLFFAAMIAGRFTGSRLARTFRGPTLLIGAFALALAGFPVFWFGPNAAIALAGLFVAGLGVANFYPLSIAVATGVAADQADLATARLAIAGGSALLIVPFIVGAVSDVIGMRWGLGIVLPLIAGALTAVLLGLRASNERLLRVAVTSTAN